MSMNRFTPSGYVEPNPSLKYYEETCPSVSHPS